MAYALLVMYELFMSEQKRVRIGMMGGNRTGSWDRTPQRSYALRRPPPSTGNAKVIEKDSVIPTGKMWHDPSKMV